jgi:hypothetical protein
MAWRWPLEVPKHVATSDVYFNIILVMCLTDSAVDILYMSQPDRLQRTKRRMRFACRIHKATNTHKLSNNFFIFHCNSGYANAPQCYVIRTLHVSLLFPAIYVSVLQVLSFVKFAAEYSLCIFLLPHTCHMSSPFNPPRFHHPNNILWAA